VDPDRPRRAVIGVRTATTDDVAAMIGLHEEVAAEGTWIATESPVDRERFARLLVESIESHEQLRLVAVDGEPVVGHLGLNPNGSGVMYLGMVIGADYRGRGVGTAMMLAAIEWARAQNGVHKIELEVWPHNAAAIALYRKVGFQVEGRRRRQYRRRNGELWDAILMGLVLDDVSPGSPHPDRLSLEQETPG
jgi:RimJ/RimL family protein N-acetyltransferase